MQVANVAQIWSSCEALVAYDFPPGARGEGGGAGGGGPGQGRKTQ